MNRILVDSGVTVNLMPYKTFLSLHLTPYLQKVYGVAILGFNQKSQEAIGRVDVDLALDNFVTKVSFYIIDADTSYRVLLGRPWLHKNWVVPSTLHQCIKYTRDGEQFRVFADLEPFTVYECHLTNANLYFESTEEIKVCKGQSKGKAKVEPAIFDNDDITVNESKLRNFAMVISKENHPERRAINLEVQTIN